jgi:hypothetical protein
MNVYEYSITEFEIFTIVKIYNVCVMAVRTVAIFRL